MCGIIGSFPKQDISSALDAIIFRGRDFQTVEPVSSGVFGHVLHAETGYTPQPFRYKGSVLLFNGQIYNYAQLASEEGLSVSSDTEVLSYLLYTYGIDAIRSRLDGVYAFAFYNDGTVTLERDVLGVKPLWYAHSSTSFVFASEKKALVALGISPRELHPRTTLRCCVDSYELSTSTRPFVFPSSDEPLESLFVSAVQKRIPQRKKVGVLFSGGVDSSLVALLAKQSGCSVTLYVAALDDEQKSIPHDLLAARQAASELDLPLVECTATLSEVEDLLPDVCRIIEDSGVVKVGVALTFALACKKASECGERVLLSGLGAEEVFAGYQRHKQSVDINAECLRGLRSMFERDLYRDDVLSMRYSLELRLPFLDHLLVGSGLLIPAEQKIVDGITKMPLRMVASSLGLSDEIVFRKKRAAQYGSQSDAAIAKLARRKLLSKSAYLRSFYPSNGRLCALLSGGKDSVYALYTMQKLNYDVVVCGTVESVNEESFMYHTPLISFAKKQADSMQIPFLSVQTPGVEEEELSALVELLSQAKEQYAITGVVSGALFSNYQRSRIESVCEQLGLQVFAPLWHLDQEMEVREILDANFSFVLSKVAAMGLDSSWVGRVITHSDVDVLSKKLGLNVAGEGGEYESLVLDGPLFSYPLSLDGYCVVSEQSGSVEIASLSRDQ